MTKPVTDARGRVKEYSRMMMCSILNVIIGLMLEIGSGERGTWSGDITFAWYKRGVGIIYVVGYWVVLIEGGFRSLFRL